MHAHDTIVHLPSVTIPLSSDADRLLATLGHPRLVDTADGFGMSVVLGHNLLALIL